jgi:phage-related minor tail protein
MAEENLLRLVLQTRDENTNKVITQTNDNLQRLNKTAKETTFALRGVPAQFTDIVTSLQAGQNPLQVFIQQGGQLKDMFGGVAPAAKALGGYIIGLINPLTLAIAGVVGLTVAFESGRREMVEMQNALAMTSNFAGQTADSMQQAAERINKNTNLTIGQSKELVLALVSSGQIGVESFNAIADLIGDFASKTGEDVDEVLPKLLKLFSDPAKGAIELNNQMNFLNTVDQEHISHLVRIGEFEEARLVLAQRLEQHISKQSKNLGIFGQAWNGVKSAASAAWDAMAGIGRDKTLAEQLEEAKQELAGKDAYIETIDPGSRARAQAEVERIQNLINQEKAATKAAAETADQTKRRSEWLKEIQKSQAYTLKQLQDEMTLAKSQVPANAEEALQQQSRIAELNKKILDAQGLGEKSISSQIRGYETLRDKAIQAYEAAGKAAEDAAKKAQAALDNAGAIRQSAKDKILNRELATLPQEDQDAIRNSEIERALQKADNFNAQANYQRFLGNTKDAERQLQLADEQVERAQQLADALKDERLARDQITAAAEAAAQNEESRAAIEKKNEETARSQQQELLKQINENGERIDALKTKLDSVTTAITEISQTTLKINTDDSSLDATLAKLRQAHLANAANFTGVYDSNGNAVYKEPPKFADGGILPGYSPHDRADDHLYIGTAGEGVVNRPAMRFYGSAWLDAVNKLKLPKFASGGVLGRVSVPSLSSSIPSGSGRSLQPMNLTIPGVGTFPVQAERGTAQTMQRQLALESLKYGSPK